MAVRKFCPA
jgi:hypothetical protein